MDAKVCIEENAHLQIDIRTIGKPSIHWFPNTGRTLLGMTYRNILTFFLMFE